MKVEDQDLIMEADTGALVAVISEATRGRIWLTQLAPPPHPTDVQLRIYMHQGGDSSGREAGG